MPWGTVAPVGQAKGGCCQSWGAREVGCPLCAPPPATWGPTCCFLEGALVPRVSTVGRFWAPPGGPAGLSPWGTRDAVRLGIGAWRKLWGERAAEGVGEATRKYTRV